MHVTANASDSERNGNLAAFVASSKEYLAFQILKGEAGGAPLEVAFAFTGDTESPRFDGRPAAEVAKALKQAALVWLPPRLAKDKDARVFLHNVAPVLGVPAVSLAVSFTHGDTHLWAILTVWQTRFALALPNSSLVKGVLIDDDGRIFASPDLREAVLAARVPEDRLTRAAMTSEAEASFVGYQDRQGIAWLGAFHRLPRYGVTAIVRRDARSQYLETRTIIQRTAYWGWVFVLLAVLVSFVVSSGLTQKLREVTAVTQKIAAGDFDTTLVVRGGDEVAFLGKAVIKMAAQLKNLVATEKEKARIDRELETARVVQNAFFPKTLSAPGRLGVVGHYRSATECGGDWWGHFPLADGRDLIGIGDATGHGAGPRHRALRPDGLGVAGRLPRRV
jgi:HAMP domain-containing protein